MGSLASGKRERISLFSEVHEVLTIGAILGGNIMPYGDGRQNAGDPSITRWVGADIKCQATERAICCTYSLPR